MIIDQVASLLPPPRSEKGGVALTLEGYSGGFEHDGTLTPILDRVTFSLRRGALTALVGESGSGKTLTALSILRILPRNFRVTGGRIVFEGLDILALGERDLREVRGRRISVVFQDARAALNPVITVGRQIADVARRHQKMTRRAAYEHAVAALSLVQIPEPERRARQYPHEFSGGMAQRVMIAMALVCEPELLILDEPTTGLDATIQADIMALIKDLGNSRGVTSLLITHDLGVVMDIADDVVVMRQGTVVEVGSTASVFLQPSDPYTRELLAASRLGRKARD